MTKFFSLVKLLFVQQYRIKPTGGKKKRTGAIVVIIVLALCLLPTVLGLIYAAYILGKTIGRDVGVVSIMVLISQGLVLLFGTITVISSVFNSKDADKLLFLPMRPITIFLAKLVVVYFNEVITTAVVILIALVPFGIGAQVAIGYYLTFPILLLLVPVLPLFVACMFAIPLSALMAKLRNANVLKTILQILMFVAIIALYLVVYFKIFGVADSDDFGTGVEGVIEGLVDRLRTAGSKLVYLHPDYMLASAMLASSFGSWVLAFILTTAENAALFAVVFLAALPFYKWILSASTETSVGRRKKGAEQVQLKNKGVLRELMSSDIKRVMRNPQFGFQAFVNLVIAPIMILVFYFAFNQTDEDGVKFLELMTDNVMYQAIAPLVFSAYISMLGVGSNVLGLYPISRENNALYLLKSLPISFTKILLAKVLLATTSILVTGFVTCVLAVALMGIKWYIGIVMMIVMALVGFGGLSITTLLDLKSPKLGWTNFNQGLKNAKNSWMGMLVGLVTSMSIALVSIGFLIWCSLADNVTEKLLAIAFMWLAVVVVTAVFATVSYKTMSRKAAEYFEKIEP